MTRTTFALTSPTRLALVSPTADGAATVTIRGGYQNRDTLAVKLFTDVAAAKAWARGVLAVRS
jgi:hypothetical protein